MKNIINWIKNFFYNITDYIIIIVILVAIVGILFWRFDKLFSLDIDKNSIENVANNKTPDDNSVNTNNKSDNSNDNNDENSGSSDDSNNGNSDNPGSSDDSNNGNSDNPGNSDDSNNNNSDNNNEETPITGQEIKITIPAGSYPAKIADILIANKLITDKKEFLNRAVELKLDTKLNAGTFKIKLGTSLDDIIKIIARKN